MSYTLALMIFNKETIAILIVYIYVIILKEIYKEIREETQNDKHYTYGMFVFVIMSHGLRGDIILDRNGQPVDLMQIKDLLSPRDFPAMSGKPKLMVVQACSGGEFNQNLTS